MTSIDKNRLGMLCFLATEVIFFGMLIMGYVYFKLSDPSRSPNANVLDIGTTAIFTVFLLSSSVTIWFAERSLQKGNRRMLVIWLGLTLVLGLVFIGGQISEYLKLLNENITVSRNTFGTSFYTVTGFHGLHVLIGLVALSIITFYAARGYFRTSHSSALTSFSYYWHFVDAVWVVVFTTIYLLA